MSVPTTLQGTHDGCGGKVTFRPATHRRELLAGHSVVLSAACSTCGATLETQWQLPAAVIHAHEARMARPAEAALPMAAGAEGMSQAPATDPWHDAARPAPQPATERPVASLGDWRMRARPEQPPAAVPQVPEAASEPAADVDPAMRAYLERFSSRVEHAREHLRQASTGLPSAFRDGDAGFRSPDFTRRPALAPSSLSSTPAALRPSVEAPAGAAVADAVERAIASPTFHDDDATPLLGALPVETPAAAPETSPAPEAVEPVLDVEAEAVLAPMPEAAQPELAVEPVVDAEPEPIVEPVPPAEAQQVVDAPLDLDPPVATVAPALVEPAPVDVHAATIAALPAPAAPADVAPTDSDVFPAEPSPLGPPPALASGSAPLGPPPPLASGSAPTVPAPALAASQPDAAANVWENLPVAPVAPVAAPAAPPAPPAPTALAATAPAMPTPDSFGAAFDDALVAGPPAGAPAPAPAVAAAPAMPLVEEPLIRPERVVAQAMPALAGATVAEPDVAVAFEPDRGFDWGPDGDAAAQPRRRRLGRRRSRPDADPAAGPEVVFEPAPDADLAAAASRVRIGTIPLVLILALAVVCGIAAFKVFSTETVAVDTGTVTDPAVAVPPADGAADPAADPAAAGADGAAANAGGAAGTPRGGARGAGAAANAATPPRTPGTAVADAPAAGTAATAPSSNPRDAQVPTAGADTPVVTASEAPSPDSNPFVRP